MSEAGLVWQDQESDLPAELAEELVCYQSFCDQSTRAASDNIPHPLRDHSGLSGLYPQGVWFEVFEAQVPCRGKIK